MGSVVIIRLINYWYFPKAITLRGLGCITLTLQNLFLKQQQINEFSMDYLSNFSHLIQACQNRIYLFFV